MIVNIATTYRPDDMGLEKYYEKMDGLVKELHAVIPNSEIWSEEVAMKIIDDPQFCYKSVIVHPKFLEARLVNTKLRCMLTYSIAQARKRAVNFFIVRPFMSSKNYTEKRLEYHIDATFNNECDFFEFVKMVKE